MVRASGGDGDFDAPAGYRVPTGGTCGGGNLSSLVFESSEHGVGRVLYSAPAARAMMVAPTEGSRSGEPALGPRQAGALTLCM